MLEILKVTRADFHRFALFRAFKDVLGNVGLRAPLILVAKHLTIEICPRYRTL